MYHNFSESERVSMKRLGQSQSFEYWDSVIIDDPITSQIRHKTHNCSKCLKRTIRSQLHYAGMYLWLRCQVTKVK